MCSVVLRMWYGLQEPPTMVEHLGLEIKKHVLLGGPGLNDVRRSVLFVFKIHGCDDDGNYLYLFDRIEEVVLAPK